MNHVLPLLLLLGLAPAMASAAWLPNGNPVSIEPGSERLNALVSDGAGGCFVLWTAQRPGQSVVLLRRHDASGDVAAGWPSEGLVLPGFQFAIADGSGGVYVMWGDPVAHTVRATRVTAQGTIADGWSAGGNAIGTDRTFGGNVTDASLDGTGGLQLSWDDPTCIQWNQHQGTCTAYGVAHWTQRVSGDGTLPSGWSATGFPLFGEQYSMPGRAVVPTPSGGSLVVVSHGYGAHVTLTGMDATGQRQFQRDQPLSVYLWSLKSRTDFNGGAYLVWSGFSNGVHLRLLRVGSNGLPSPGWPSLGLQILGTSASRELAVQPVSDGTAYAVWQNQDATVNEPRAIRVGGDATVDPGWPSDGLRLAPGAGWSVFASTAEDGGVGCLAALHGPDGLYAQHVRSDATFDESWGANGLAPLAVTSGVKRNARLIPDGQGGLFAAWEDDRDAATNGTDVYFQHLDAHGRPFQPPRPPDVTGAVASTARLWPPLNDFVPVAIDGVVDPEGGPVSIVCTGIRQDEPLVTFASDAAEDLELVPSPPAGGRSRGEDDPMAATPGQAPAVLRAGPCPDARIEGGVAFIRRERDGGLDADGRVYELTFVATDSDGMSSTGVVTACVPRRGRQTSCVDSGLRFDSMGPCPTRGRDQLPTDFDLRSSGAAVEPALHVERSAGGFVVAFAVAVAGDVRLDAYDVAGRHLANLRRGAANAGMHRVAWDTNGLQPGVYFVRLALRDRELSRRVLVTP